MQMFHEKKIEVLLVLPFPQQRKTVHRQSCLKFFHFFLILFKTNFKEVFFLQSKKKSEILILQESFPHDLFRSEFNSI